MSIALAPAFANTGRATGRQNAARPRRLDWFADHNVMGCNAYEVPGLLDRQGVHARSPRPGGTVYSWLGMVPLKCHHCYHKFTVPWFLTIGKRLTPPALKTRLTPATASGQHSLSSHPAETGSDSHGPLRRAA